MVGINFDRKEFWKPLIQEFRKLWKVYIKIFNILFNLYLGIFVVFAVIYILLSIVSPTPNYDEIIKNGERGAIFLISMAGLTFTYAAALDGSGKKDITKNGKYFLKSVLYFVIGMIFSLEFRQSIGRQALTNPAPTSDFNLFLIFLPLFIGFAIIFSSGYFFVKGVTGLLKSLRIED
ncbi:MAG: hypothetical protein WCE94_01865 [Candidatus Methanoperedens sp.]